MATQIYEKMIFPMNVVNAADIGPSPSLSWFSGLSPTDSWQWYCHTQSFDMSNIITPGCFVSRLGLYNNGVSPLYRFANGEKPFIRRLRFTASCEFLDYMCNTKKEGSGAGALLYTMSIWGGTSDTVPAHNVIEISPDLFKANEWLDVNDYLPIVNTASGEFAMLVTFPAFEFEFSQKYSGLSPNLESHNMSTYGNPHGYVNGETLLRLECEVVHNTKLVV